MLLLAVRQPRVRPLAVGKPSHQGLGDLRRERGPVVATYSCHGRAFGFWHLPTWGGARTLSSGSHCPTIRCGRVRRTFQCVGSPPRGSCYAKTAWAPTVGCTSGAGPGTTWRRSVRPSPGGGPWDTRSHWMPNRSPSEPSRFGPVEASPTDEAAARSAPRVAAGRTWPARRRRPPGRGRRRRAPSGSRPPDARSKSLFSHAPITPLHRKVLPYRRTRLTSCIHHSFRTAPPVPSARPGRLRRTH
jgi:hypothetical protein